MLGKVTGPAGRGGSEAKACHRCHGFDQIRPLGARICTPPVGGAGPSLHRRPRGGATRSQAEASHRPHGQHVARQHRWRLPSAAKEHDRSFARNSTPSPGHTPPHRLHHTPSCHRARHCRSPPARSRSRVPDPATGAPDQKLRAAPMSAPTHHAPRHHPRAEPSCRRGMASPPPSQLAARNSGGISSPDVPQLYVEFVCGP